MPGLVESETSTACQCCCRKGNNGINGESDNQSDVKDTSTDSENTTMDSPADAEDAEEEKKKPEKQKCEVQAYEARYNSRGERELVALDAKAANKEDADSDDEKRKFAICSSKWYSRNGEIEESQIEIMSPFIIVALQVVINQYPDQHFWSEDGVTIDAPYRPIFHYRKELAEYAEKLEDEEAKSHVNLLLTFCERENRRAISEYEANVVNAISTPSIRYKNLWMLLKPGQLFFTGSGSSLRCMEIVDSYQTTGNCAAYIVTGRSFTHNGEQFGYAERRVRQSPFKGMKAIEKLNYIPHDFFEEREMARKVLIRRGHKFCDLAGSHYRTYTGTVSALANVRDWDSWGEYKEEPLIIQSRIMVDAKMFGVVKSPNRITLDDVAAIPKDCSAEELADFITEKDLFLADFRVPGYALQTKRWCWFLIDAIKPVVFNSDAFDSLLIPKRQKTLVHSLVKVHVSGTDDFDDMIAGKGKGLVFVLHGAPGVGKTFTAESVADHIERPLYILNSGELGIQPAEVEENLDRALMLAVAWNAILLIDEADVFLEQRSIQDLQRNCLVSLFLRTLEYYEGILFLTTNRITTFDPAFKSRIHLALKYNALTTAARKELFINFISRTSKTPPVFDDETLNRLSAVDINGRQIKNAVRTASALARDEKVPLNEEHLQTVLETIAEFEQDLASTDEWSS